MLLTLDVKEPSGSHNKNVTLKNVKSNFIFLNKKFVINISV